MNTLGSYVISFRGLSAGAHNFSWDIDGKFFETDNFSEISEAGIQVDLQLQKSERLMQLDFSAQGTLKLPCDRCLAPMEIVIDASRTLILRESDRDESDDDDIVFLSSNEYQVSVAEWIREMIILSLPMRNVHDEDECDAEMIRKLEKLSDDSGTEPFIQSKI